MPQLKFYNRLNELLIPQLFGNKLSYTASQNVQLVVFHGPLGSVEGKGQRIWSPDNGKTKYSLTDIDLGGKMGNLIFAGNGLVIRSSSDKPFTVSYALVRGN